MMDIATIAEQQQRQAGELPCRKSDARYLHLLKSNLFCVGVGDLSGNILDGNDAMLNMLGYSRAELDAGILRWTELTPPEYLHWAEASVREAITTGVCPAFEMELLRKDGSRVPILCHIALAPDDPEDIVVSVIDLTKQKQAEKELRTSEARLRLLVDGSTDYAFIMLDPNGYVTSWNAGAERIKGYQAEEIIGKHFSVFYPTDDAANGKPQRELQQALEGRIEDEGWRVRKDGSRFWANVTLAALRDNAGRLQGFAKITKDITEQRRTDVLLSSTLKSVIDGIVGIDERGQIESFNAAAERIFGYKESEILGENVKVLMPDPHRNEHDAYIANYLRTGERKIIGIGRQVAARRKDGTTFPVEITVSEFLLYDQRHFAGVIRDITQQRALEDQLRQAQKMEAIGQLAGGVAHDFNNMLTVILSYSELLLDMLPSADPLREYVRAIGESGQRAAAMTRQLLAFSRRAILEPKVLDLNRVVRETEKMLGRLIGDDVTVVTVLAPTLKRVMIDPGQMDQVIMNLAINARDAMPQGGRLTIETSNAEFDEADAALHRQARPGRYVKLTMTDTGCGMTADVKAHIFEPFFTTKGPGKGTGLGLATIYGIIEQSGGHIEVSSQVGEGTSFGIFLPAVEQELSSEEDGDTTKVKGGTETILLVEDDHRIRKMALPALQRHGYTVLQAANGKQALHVFENYWGHIDLLLADVVMPEMNGRQLAEALSPRFPDMKVLYMSGYTDDAVIHHGVRQAEAAFLQKPFTPVSLAKKVRKVLDNENTGTPFGGPVNSSD